MCNDNFNSTGYDSDDCGETSLSNSPVLPRKVVPSPPLLPPRRPSPTPSPTQLTPAPVQTPDSTVNINNPKITATRLLTVPKENAPPPPVPLTVILSNENTKGT